MWTMNGALFMWTQAENVYLEGDATRHNYTGRFQGAIERP